MAGRARQPRSVLERGLMTTNITPDKAQELLRGDFASDAKQTLVGNLEAGTIITGAYIFGTPGDFALTEAAPALAQTVANLHYEYAVQETDRGWYLREREDGKLVKVADPADADWWYEQDACADYVRWLNTRAGYNVRVVRRLATDPEVVE